MLLKKINPGSTQKSISLQLFMEKNPSGMYVIIHTIIFLVFQNHGDSKQNAAVYSSWKL